MMRSTRAPRSEQRGQALTEFLVAAVALIPLFLLIPLIAKYQDINHAVQLASRYAAFDATIRNAGASTWKDPAQLADEVRRRYFSDADAPVKTGDVAGNFKANQNLFWRGPRDEPLIEDIARDVQVTFGEGGSATQSDGFTPSADGQPFVLRNGLDLKANGIFTANVSVALFNMPADLRFYRPFDQINLNISRRTSVVVDPWTARDPQDVEARILRSPTVFPAGQLAQISPLAGGAVALIEMGLVQGPMLGQLEFWRDVVPQDRLRQKQSEAASSWP